MDDWMIVVVVLIAAVLIALLAGLRYGTFDFLMRGRGGDEVRASSSRRPGGTASMRRVKGRNVTNRGSSDATMRGVNAVGDVVNEAGQGGTGDPKH